MTKKEFLDELTESLAGNVPSDVIADNINYYKNYIENSDMSEEDALAELGDPHLIARTIIDSFMASKGPMADYYKEQARSEYSQNPDAYENVNYGDEINSETYQKKSFIPKWYDKLMGIIVMISIVALVLVLGAVAVKIIFRVVLPIAVILFIIRFIADRFNRRR